MYSWHWVGLLIRSKRWHGIVGLVVLPFLLAPNWLVGVAAVVCLAFYVAMPLINTHIPSPTNDWIGEHVARADAIYRHGNFAAVFRFNIEDVANIVPLHLFVFPRTVGLFLLGALSWRLRLWRDAHAHKIAITLIAIVGLWAGIALPAVKGASTSPAPKRRTRPPRGIAQRSPGLQNPRPGRNV